ncbi:hypothetical protein C900_00126 [Fulvivirga imtechensis AK7]|uniref:DUF1330 domain-containing protein n=1 Tax=Fulvivirga imtechensis AK7 TaxID=1237149 RepID=L8JVG7_9BACT|nr:hypothetical protein [Fulvivirga imtechensis]ELR73046.1 hypothetical protein C900_00126 [Fulvivirga imtechensis AK7]
MIYITQFIFIKPGKEEVFHQFEELAIPLMKKYNGRLIYRLRPGTDSFVVTEEEQPYEIHFVSFASENDLESFMGDEDRLKFMHLKEESIKWTLLVKGEKM